MMNAATDLKPCPCGNQKIARSYNLQAAVFFCSDCGRFAEAKSVRQASALWNSGSHQSDKNKYSLTGENSTPESN